MMRVALGLLVAVALTACESVPFIPVEPDPQAAHAEHSRKVSALVSWTLEGRISIRLQEEAWHAGLFWHQISDIYQIRLIAPFGQGGAQLDGNANGVVLNNGEAEFRADSADQLLAEQFGWQIPVEGLRFWATGQTAPSLKAEVRYDDSGRVSELRQGDWRVEYRAYVPVKDMILPAKIFLKHRSGLDVRVVVDNWQTRSDQVAGQ